MITLYGDHVIKLDSGPRMEIPDADWLSSGVCLEALHDGQIALWFAYSTMLFFFVDISLLQVQISTKEDKHGQTALRTAAHQSHVECLKELIAAGADINKEDKHGRVPFFSRSGSIFIVPVF